MAWAAAKSSCDMHARCQPRDASLGRLSGLIFVCDALLEFILEWPLFEWADPTQVCGMPAPSITSNAMFCACSCVSSLRHATIASGFDTYDVFSTMHLPLNGSRACGEERDAARTQLVG